MKRLALLIAATALVDCSQDMKQTNLLFIMHDDLRPQLNNYGLDYMITPNYDRLAQKSVVFDYAFCQVAVCNPSRDSLLTGLRPDVLGTYNFQHSFAPHILLPVQLVRSGYNTAMFGKMLHWPNGDPAIWNFEHWENDWYKYQNMERNSMNSSTMPDKIKPEEEFRDALFTNRAIKSLRAMAEQPKPFMLAVGFKLPHLELHVPYKYYEMYKDKSSSWKLSSKERRFPTTANHVSYRCCAEPKFSYMREEGAIKSNKSLALGDINAIIPTEVRNQLMAGYCAGITFVDKQLGRILDALDELDLWKNTTVVLTSDHGMHNGEKGLWDKWSLFEESTRVPLMIHHPLSPYKGERYPYPVELVDVYPTLNHLLRAPYDKAKVCKDQKCEPLSGKSLARVVLGNEIFNYNFPSEMVSRGDRNSTNKLTVTSRMLQKKDRKKDRKMKLRINRLKSAELDTAVKTTNSTMPILDQRFAISQSLRCAEKKWLAYAEQNLTRANILEKLRRAPLWNDCDITKHDADIVSLLGYAMRTPEYRYIAYFYFDLKYFRVDLTREPYAEELYDHHFEKASSFTHQETVNVITRPKYRQDADQLLQSLKDFIKTIDFHNQTLNFFPK